MKVSAKLKKYFSIVIVLVAIALLLPACAKKQPVLYPNATYNAAGPTAAQADIDDCIRLAADHGHATDAGKNVAKSTAAGAAVGAAARRIPAGRPGERNMDRVAGGLHSATGR